jgi:hypothetical protein
MRAVPAHSLRYSGAILLGHAAQLVIDPKSVKVYRQSKATIKVTVPAQRRQNSHANVSGTRSNAG